MNQGKPVDEPSQNLFKKVFLFTKIPLIYFVLACVFIIVSLLFYSSRFSWINAMKNQTHTQAAITSNNIATSPVQPRLSINTSDSKPKQPSFFPSPFIGVGLKQTSSGVQVVSIIPNTPASNADLHTGDYIEQAGKTPELSGIDNSVSSVLDILRIIQSIPEGNKLYLTIKRGEQVIKKELTVKYITNKSTWYSGDICGTYYSLTLPEIKLDNVIRGWKIETIAANNKGYSFTDPANSKVTVSVWESYNAQFGNKYANADTVLDSLIPPSVENYRKLKIDLYPAAIYNQTEDGVKEVILIVSGPSPGAQVGIDTKAPSNVYSNYKKIFDEIFDSLVVSDLDKVK